RCLYSKRCVSIFFIVFRSYFLLFPYLISKLPDLANCEACPYRIQSGQIRGEIVRLLHRILDGGFPSHAPVYLLPLFSKRRVQIPELWSMNDNARPGIVLASL